MIFGGARHPGEPRIVAARVGRARLSRQRPSAAGDEKRGDGGDYDGSGDHAGFRRAMYAAFIFAPRFAKIGRSAVNSRGDRYPSVASFPDTAGTSIS